MEGESVKVMLTVVDKDDKAIAAAEKLTVSLTPSSGSSQDYRLSTHPIVIDKGDKSSASVDLTLEQDDDLGMEMLVFDASVAGDSKIGADTRSVVGVLSLAIEDGTMKLVEANSDADVQAVIYAAKDAGEGADEMFNPGETIEIDASMLFTVGEGATAEYTASSDMASVASASSSGGMVTVMAVAPGEGAMITITATAEMMSGAMSLPQTSPNVARVEFPVDVALAALTVGVTADPMEIMEGGMSTITATASRDVAASDGEVKVDLEVIGDGELSATSITIAAGSMVGHRHGDGYGRR